MICVKKNSFWDQDLEPMGRISQLVRKERMRQKRKELTPQV